ncbi:hypothetical protein [Clostridium sp. AWRP]|uniref:hypothetical protein n=1 Tax=Clostridium sp. AWRP TaxID=2212991 RepID=UPI001586C8C7|nr:hypothetical protein [Clostridium sp. AWRP]
MEINSFLLDTNYFSLKNEETFSIQTFEISELTRNILKDWIPIFQKKGLDYGINIPEYPIIVKVDLKIE